MTCNFAACLPRQLIGSRLALLTSLNINAKSKVESIPEMVILPVIQPWQTSKTSPETNQIWEEKWKMWRFGPTQDASGEGL